MRISILIPFLFVVTSDVAIGSPITVKFAGEVTQLIGTAQVGVGTPVSGTYTFDSDTSPTFNGDPTRPGFFYYNHFESQYGGTLSLGGASYFTDQPMFDGRRLVILMFDNDRFENDRFILSTVLGSSGSPLSGSFDIILSDPTQQALSSPALLVGAPDLTDWGSARFSLSTATGFVLGSISEMVVIPEPSAALLVMLGMSVLSIKKASLTGRGHG